MTTDVELPAGKPRPPQASRRILVLHGGGYRGLFTAKVLELLERKAREVNADGELRLSRCFDLIAGTSIGGILAIALACDVPPSDLYTLLKDNGAEIFPPTAGRLSRLRRDAKSVGQPRYGQAKLREVVSKTLPDLRFDQLSHAVIVPALAENSRQPRLFTSMSGPDQSRERLLDVALATSAAPLYFPSHQVEDDPRPLLDGGVIANSPSWIALTMALTRLRWPLDHLQMLVVGTTRAPTGSLPKAPERKGLRYWLTDRRILEVLLDGQLNLADAMCSSALGPDRYCKIDAFRSPEEDAAAGTLDQATDDATKVLTRLAHDAVDQASTNIRQILRR